MGLFGRKSDHPMADLASARHILEGLSRDDPLKALHELTHWMDVVREESTIRLDHQLEVLRLLDETARPFENKLTREYFSAAAPSEFQEKRLWMGLNEFSLRSAQAYAAVLARYISSDRGSSAVKSFLPLVAARGIRAVTGRLKCAAAHYAPIEPELWKYLADFYAHAEARRYLDDPVALYAGSGGETSVRRVFAAALLWHGLCAGSMSRLRVHLAERLTAYLSGKFSVEAQYSTNSQIGFDLQQAGPPFRAGSGVVQQPGMRFLGVGDLQPDLGALLDRVGRGVVPEDIDLGGAYEASAVSDVVRYLMGRLTASPRKRRNARHQIKVNLNVASGFAQVLEQTDIGLNFGDSDSKTWEVDDVSISGFRYVAPAQRANDLKIGLLIGIKPEKKDRWGVGVVRRLHRDQHDNLQVGVEILANQMTGVLLRDGRGGGERPGLWLGGDEEGEARILVGSDAFVGGHSLRAHLGGRNYLLIPTALLEKGEDYDLVRFRKIEEDTGA